MKDYMIPLFVVLIQMINLFAASANNAYCQNSPAIEMKITLDRQSYKVGEPIMAVCELRNMSKSTVWLPPLQIVDVHFSLHKGDIEISPFASPSMPFYGFSEQGFIELIPGQTHLFKRILDNNAYKMPSDAGEYRLCIHYENHKESMRNTDLWVGKVSSCVPLKIE